MRNNQFLNNMRTTRIVLGNVPYVTPSMEVNEMIVEGILCASDSGNDKGATTEEWDVVDLSKL